MQDRVLKSRKRDYLAWYNRGEILAKGKKDYKEAVKSYDKALEFNPNFYPALLWKGVAHTSLQEYSEALKAFDTAKELEAKDSLLWANRGFVLEKMGRKQDAIASYQTAIQIDPNFKEVREALERLGKKVG